MKTCRACAELIQDEARVCRYCGLHLERAATASGARDALRGIGQGISQAAREITREANERQRRIEVDTAEVLRLAEEQDAGEVDEDISRRLARRLEPEEHPRLVFTARLNWGERIALLVTDRRILSSDGRPQVNLDLDDLVGIATVRKGGPTLHLGAAEAKTVALAKIRPEQAAGRVASHLLSGQPLRDLKPKELAKSRRALRIAVPLACLGLVVAIAIATGAGESEKEPPRERSPTSGASFESSEPSPRVSPKQELETQLYREECESYADRHDLYYLELSDPDFSADVELELGHPCP